MANRTTEVETWYGSQRGVRPETLDAFGITVDSKGNVCYPYPNSTKLRATEHGLPAKARWWEPPLGQGEIVLYGLPAPTVSTTGFLVEGESDTMRLWQELKIDGKENSTGVRGLSGVNTWRPALVEQVPWDTVYVILDNDDPYENADAHASVERAWPLIRKDLKRKAIRVRLPKGTKDICEFFDRYDMAAFKAMCANAPKTEWHFEAMDFTQPPKPIDWMMAGVFAHRSFNMLVGHPGLGKSFLTQGLAVAMLEKWPHFMGRSLRHTGPVLYFDEENPPDVIHRRMKNLGLTEQGQANLRYISYGDVDVLRSWPDILGEADMLEPTLVVFDSFAEITSGDENAKKEVAEALKNLKGLTRTHETTCIVIHHADKEKGEARGSGHIRAAADAEWALQEANQEETLRLVCKKHRYGIPRGTTHLFSIDDLDEGGETRTTLRPIGEDIF